MHCHLDDFRHLLGVEAMTTAKDGLNLGSQISSILLAVAVIPLGIWLNNEANAGAKTLEKIEESIKENSIVLTGLLIREQTMLGMDQRLMDQNVRMLDQIESISDRIGRIEIKEREGRP